MCALWDDFVPMVGPGPNPNPKMDGPLQGICQQWVHEDLKVKCGDNVSVIPVACVVFHATFFLLNVPAAPGQFIAGRCEFFRSKRGFDVADKRAQDGYALNNDGADDL
jgi:hypothetical protein